MLGLKTQVGISVMGDLRAEARISKALADGGRFRGHEEESGRSWCGGGVARVAVIGAGAAGLVAARELKREGHQVVVYEQSDAVGGVWVYDPKVEDDPVGAVSSVHSSMYESLRTNLPRELMGFLDFPFLPKQGRDLRRFPGHQEVRLYLEDFAREFDVMSMVRFNSGVDEVRLREVDGKTGCWFANLSMEWVVRSEMVEEAFDAVVVCNGHYSQPKTASIPGIEVWPGFVMHSHNYRVAAPFKDQVVITIGSAASGEDISREIATVAREVHLCARAWGSSFDVSKPDPDQGNLWRHPMIQSVCEDGAVIFEDGYRVVANTIIHCTGYRYSFPFLDAQGLVLIEDNQVGPLYQHVFPPALSPSLAFVGLPYKVVPFPLCELQSKWIARILSGKLSLPSAHEMMEAVQKFYSDLESRGIPKRYTHNMDTCQFAYLGWLAEQCQCKVEPWREKMYATGRENKRSHPTTYRDVWTDHELMETAYSSLLHSQEPSRTKV